MKNWKHNPPKLRPSFTLVELLIAIAIIGIMSSMILWTVMGAQNDARIARTRGTIQKLNDVILQSWEEYRYKPVDVRITGEIPVGVTVTPRERARTRMLILRDAMRMEMPDRITDLLYLPSEYTVAHSGGASKIPRAIPPKYGILVEMLRQNLPSGFSLASVPSSPLASSGTNRLATGQTDEQWTDAIEGSELLYLIVASSQYAGSSALEFFRPSEIGDVDGDGLPEFVDGWGRSIQWIRWPAGYPGDLIRYADDDAMDSARTDWRYRNGVDAAWHPRTLVPLIISAGADEEFGVTFDFYDSVTPPIVYATMRWPNNPNPPYGTIPGNTHYSAGDYFYIDPFYTNDFLAPGDSNQIGSIPPSASEFAVDNITNHDIILEP